MAATEAQDFPNYADGDVCIVVSPQRLFKLHSMMLKRYSPFFQKEIDAHPPARLTLKARQEGACSIRFELVTSNQQDTGYFQRKHVNDSGRVPDSILMRSDLNSNNTGEAIAHYWDWLLGSFYGRQPAFDDQNLATVLTDCMGLVDAAESIGSVDHVREVVDLALLRQDNILWQSIKGNPMVWAELGRRVHSPTIFKEGVCHLVGTWNRLTTEAKAEMNDDIRTLCEKKANDLEIAKEAIEMRILGHYPAFLHRRAADRPGRPTYANDIYMWMVVCFFRQWFAQAISDKQTRAAEDGGFKFYTALSKGGQAYLHHEDFSQFHQYFPMSSKGCNVLEANMGVLKEDIKQFVADLVKVRVHLKPEENEMDWLTCAVIENEDCPWRQPEEEEQPFMGDLFGDGGAEDDTIDMDVDASPAPPVPSYLPMRSTKGKKQGDGLSHLMQGEMEGSLAEDSGFMADDDEGDSD